MRKNILFILPFHPWPLRSGGHQAIFNGIVAVKDFFNIFIVYPVGTQDVLVVEHDELKKQLDGNVTICPFVSEKEDESISRKLVQFVKSLLIKKQVDKTPRPFSIYINEEAYLQYVNNIIAQYSIDIVQVEMMENISFVLSLPETVRRIFVHHEIMFIRHELAFDVADLSLSSQALVKFEKLKEIELLNQYDEIVTLSSIDKQKLREAGVSKPIHASFAVVKTSEISERYPANMGVITFVGPEIHAPNRIGIQWFLDNCWSGLLDKRPHYRLHIIGEWTDVTKQAWRVKYPNIDFRGFVPDLASAIHDTIMIVPITVGSGIRMKILEAMLYCVPFVSTSVGAEGIPVKNGENCFITDESEDFIENIILLEKDELRKQFVTTGFELVKRHYSLDMLKEERKKLYNL